MNQNGSKNVQIGPNLSKLVKTLQNTSKQDKKGLSAVEFPILRVMEDNL